MNMLIFPLLIAISSASCNNIVILYYPFDELDTYADLSCQNDPYSTSDKIITIEPSNHCELYCNGELKTTVYCQDGEWKGSPELGFWCKDRPTKLEHHLSDKDFMCSDNNNNEFRVNNDPQYKDNISKTYTSCTKTCSNLVIPYEPTQPNSGTELDCEKDPHSSDGLITIEASNYCKFYCDDYHITTVYCRDGQWQGSPESGFWCKDIPTKLPDQLSGKELLCTQNYDNQFQVSNDPEHKDNFLKVYTSCIVVPNTGVFAFSLSDMSLNPLMIQGLALVGFVSTLYHVFRCLKTKKVGMEAIPCEAEI